MKKFIGDYLFLGLIAGLVIAFDQWTKSLVRQNLAAFDVWPAHMPWLTRYIRVFPIHNRGAAFGMFQNLNWLFTLLAILVSIAIIYYFPRVPRKEWYLRLALSLQLGGAIGNLIDRLVQGHVTDFISLGNLPVFNVADASISLGVAILVIGVWIRDGQQARLTRASVTQDEHTNKPLMEPYPEGKERE